MLGTYLHCADLARNYHILCLTEIARHLVRVRASVRVEVRLRIRLRLRVRLGLRDRLRLRPQGQA